MKIRQALAVTQTAYADTQFETEHLMFGAGVMPYQPPPLTELGMAITKSRLRLGWQRKRGSLCGTALIFIL